MSELDLLFAEARRDAPSAATKARVWQSVANATGAATAATAATAAAKASAAGGSSVGLFVTAAVGLAATVIALGAGLHAEDVSTSAPTAPARAKASLIGAGATPRALALEAEPGQSTARPAAPAAEAPDAPDARPAPPSAPTMAREDDLAREAQLIARARGELRRGEAERALASVRATRSLATQRLQPEALSLEARALRALGRLDEALVVEASLRSSFPEHALARP